MIGKLMLSGAKNLLSWIVMHRNYIFRSNLKRKFRWCEPCKTLAPKLEEACKKANGEWILVKFDIDALPKLASALQVSYKELIKFKSFFEILI